MKATQPIKPSRKSPVEVSYEAITPTRAKLWLKSTTNSTFKQRRLSSGVVGRYVAEMESGNWHGGTADIIRIGNCDSMEVVVDGQHRLQAIANSGKTHDMYVARNVPLDAFKYIDQGNNRTLKDVMDVAGWQHTPVLAATARYIWVHESFGSPFYSVPANQNICAGTMFDWIECYRPDLREVNVNHGLEIKAASKGIKMSEAIMMFLYIRMMDQDGDITQLVFEYLSDPLDRAIEEPSLGFKFAVEYIGEMHDKIRQMKSQGMKSRSDEHRDPCTQALILAWRSLLEGREFRTLKGFKNAMAKVEDKWSI